MRPTITVKVLGGKKQALLRGALDHLKKDHVYVGVPETTVMDRKLQVMEAAMKVGVRKKARLEKMALESAINNAQLVYIHTHGSPRRHIPPRPIIEAAITDAPNKEKIVDELRKVASAALDGKPQEVKMLMNRAGQLAENLVRGWFVNPRNNWAPNAPSTIARKKSARPLIDTGALRKAITFVVSQE